VIWGFACSCSTTYKKPDIPIFRYKVIKSYPHDRFAFTEGLAYVDGYLIEGTGLPGKSTLRRVNLETGEIILINKLGDRFFGEGIAVFDNKIVQITESNNIGFVYDFNSFEQVGEFHYPTKGWGITWDGANLIMSDGTSALNFLDPETFTRVRQIDVHDNHGSIANLNELEYVDGEIYANIWPTDRIARISPQTGKVLGWIDLEGLLTPEDRKMIGWSELKGVKLSIPIEKEASLNGIAYDPEKERLLVTGKLWPKLFEIELILTQ
jgi:glutamine cyclotransferase